MTNRDVSEELLIRDDGVPVVVRNVPTAAEEARVRLRRHENSCALNKGGTCPARLTLDTFGYRRSCLVHAVLSDDWHELLKREAPPVVMREDVAKYNEGLPDIPARYSTTGDGRWDETAPTRLRLLARATPEEFASAGGSVGMQP